MKAYISMDRGYIELVAENNGETEILRQLFQGEGPKRYHRHSFGYDKNMPKRTRGKNLQAWADQLVLTFKLV